MQTIGANQQKILLFLRAGIALTLSGSPRKYFRILKHARREWDTISRKALHEAIRKLYASKLVDARDHRDGSTTLVLTDAGKRKALRYHIEKMRIKPPKVWDKRWRIILFDVPERVRNIRDALRHHLRQLGCYEFQKSVFVHPFECRGEIDFLIEFYHARPFVRFIVADDIDNVLHLKNKFRL